MGWIVHGVHSVHPDSVIVHVIDQMVSPSSKAKTNLQFPLTHAAKCPCRVPWSGCSFHPGTFMSPGVWALSKRASRRAILAACSG